MRKYLTVLSCIIIFACCIFCVSCNSGQSENQNIFVFLSVRMKGNGDGTITAVAQNEFSIGRCNLPVTLTLYSSDTQETDVAKMTYVDSVTSERLNIYQSIKIVEKVEKQNYYIAQITYSFRGETKYIQSETVYYGTDGNRK